METQHQRVNDSSKLFYNNFLDHNQLYMYLFAKPASLTWVNFVDLEKAMQLIHEKYSDKIVDVYRYSEQERNKKNPECTTAIIVLKNQCVVLLKGNYCDILHSNTSINFVTTLAKDLTVCRRREKRKPFEINIIIKSGNYLELKAMDINKVKLDIDLFYEDDFISVDAIIKKRLNQKKDKGIVLLHGLPGTGKTTYLRYLVGSLKKKVLFVSPAVAPYIMEPDFMELLIDNPDCILVIEDAENIIIDRRTSGNSSVSNLLNISDGLLADFLNVQIICTFNSSVTMVDSALMRKGRLIAKYEFGKLGVKKAQQLSDYLGFKNTIHQPMTVAEIANQHETKFEPKPMQVLGFRRDAVLEN